MSKLKITKKHLISKAFVNVTVNIVGEYSGISEDAAQDYLERMDDINCVLCNAGMSAITEPDYVIDWSPADEQRQYKQKLPVPYVKNLARACGLVKLVCLLSVLPASSRVYTVCWQLQLWRSGGTSDVSRRCHQSALHAACLASYETTWRIKGAELVLLRERCSERAGASEWGRHELFCTHAFRQGEWDSIEV